MTSLDLTGPLAEPVRARLLELTAETPAPEGRVVLDLRIGAIDDPHFAKDALLSAADVGLPNSLKAGFVAISDAIVTPTGFLIAGGRLVFDTQILPNGWMRGGLGGGPDLIAKIRDHNAIHKLDLWRDLCRLSVPPEMETLDAPAFLFSSRLTGFNFAHLVHDTLIQTPTYLDACAHAGAALLPILVGPGFPSPVWGRIFASATGEAAKPPLFLRRRFFRVRRLYVPLTHFAPAAEAIARGAVARLMAQLGRSLRDCQTTRKRRLFISREDSSRGSDREPVFRNGDALLAALATLGIEPVVASRLDPETYLKTFVNAELIVGLHGAGLLNLVLTPTPRVLEIVAPGYPDWRSLALFMEIGMGAPYARAVTPAAGDGLFEYDIPAIIEACKTLLATPCPEPVPQL